MVFVIFGSPVGSIEGSALNIGGGVVRSEGVYAVNILEISHVPTGVASST